MINSKPIILDRKLVADVGDQHNIGSEPDLFGIEVELEGRKIRTTKELITKHWIIHDDGSLRVQKPGDEACEYVFRKPLNMEDTKIALANLFNYLTKNPETVVYDSYRTSIHVHVNCLEETIRTIVNFITLSIIFDELFVSQNGETRIGNNFCLRSRDAEGQITDAITSVSKYGSLYNLSHTNRYSSTNFGSLLKFGTVEFRSLECTTDYDRVIHWIKTLQALKSAARSYENPRDIISKFSRRGPLGFMIGHLGEQYAKYAAVPGASQMMHNGMRLAQDFAFCSEWRQPTAGEEKKTRSNLKNMYWADLQQVVAQAAPPQPAIPMHIIPNWIQQWHEDALPVGQPNVDDGPLPFAHIVDNDDDDDDDDDDDHIVEDDDDDDDFI